MFALEVVEHVKLVAAESLTRVQDHGIHPPHLPQRPHTLLVGLARAHRRADQQAPPGGNARGSCQRGQATVLEKLVVRGHAHEVASAVDDRQEALLEVVEELPGLAFSEIVGGDRDDIPVDGDRA